jgi:UDP-3-O-[3-hydroxymyristoyl] glucosamine N-acyltransferase
VGHINIGNNVAIGAQAGVINNVADGKIVLGSPAIDANQAKRAYTLLATLPEMRQSIRELQQQVARLTSGKSGEAPKPEEA